MRNVSVEFYPRDCWIGVYVGPAMSQATPHGYRRWRRIYVCPLPMLVLAFDVPRR
jgi:hypothetical protein